MSGTQQPRHVPPEGLASWLDWVVGCLHYGSCEHGAQVHHARAELSELRKELADTKRIKEVACRDLETWQLSYDEVAQALDEARVKLAIATANAAELAQQRDRLHIQVADLRRAILGLGILHYCGELLECTEEHVCATDVKRFNDLVLRLRAEAKEGAESKEEIEP